MGCIYHIRLVTEVYLKKEIITDIRIQFSETARVPDISICLYFYNFVSFVKIKEKQPKIFQRLRQLFPQVNNQSSFNEWKFSSEAIKFLTIELSQLTVSQLIKVMIDTKDLVERIDPTVRQMDVIDHVDTKDFNDCSVKTNLKEPYICMTINCPVLSVNLLKQKDLELTQLLGTVLAIYFKHKIFATTEEYYIYLHPANTLPYGSQMSSVTIVTEENSHKFYIEYKLFETKLLPPPYITSCRDYQSIGFKSQKHALETCRNKLSLNALGCGFYSDVMDAESDSKLSIGDYYIRYEDPERRKIINEIYDNCSTLYAAPDCRLEYFVPRIQKVARIDSESTIIYLSMPTEPDIINTCQPKLPLFEYLIYIGSILGTWFGFNVLTSSPQIISWTYMFLRIMTNPNPGNNHVNNNNGNNAHSMQRRNGPIVWENGDARVRSAKVRQTAPRVITWEEYLR